jgi:hypothetical protein
VERERTDALAAQRRLARARPGWFRPAARREHADALSGARERAREATERSARLRERQAELLVAERDVPTTRVERLRPQRVIGREIGR